MRVIKKSSVDVDDYSCESKTDSYCLETIDGDSIYAVVNEEGEEGSRDGDGVYQREWKHKMHPCVYDLVDDD